MRRASPVGGRLVGTDGHGRSQGTHHAPASPQVHGFFTIPVDHLHALRERAAHFRAMDPNNAVVVSPDLGKAKEAAAFARLLGLPVAVGGETAFQ